MHKFLKQSTILFIVLSLITTAFGSVAMAQDQYREHERTGEKMAVDVPFSALGGNTQEAYEEMVEKPARYTFKRQLGDF